MAKLTPLYSAPCASHGALYISIKDVWLLRAVMRAAVADVVFRNERAHDGPVMMVGLSYFSFCISIAQ